MLVLCLATGYGIAKQWVGAIIAVLLAPAWWLARKHPASPLPFICLLVSVGLAVAGRLIGSPPLLMIFDSAIALVVWDILLIDSALGSHSLIAQTRQYERQHLQSLMLALACGLIAALLGQLLTIQVPSMILILFIILLLFALDRVWVSIKKIGRL